MNRRQRAWRSALITGASSGIGAAFARALPNDTRLILTGRNEAALEGLAAELRGRRTEADAESVSVVIADLARDEGRDCIVARAEAAEIDLLINNAGLGTVGPSAENDPRREREIVEVNVVTPVVLTRALLPGMLQRARGGRGRAGVVVLASVVGFIPVPYLGTYSASKTFDLVYAECLAEELRSEPIDILALCPGATETDFGPRAGMPGLTTRAPHTAAEVARQGLVAIGRRNVHIVGASNWLATLSPRLLPRRLLNAATAVYMRRRQRSEGTR